MQAVIFAIHLIISLALVGVILLQRSEGGALGIGGGNNAMVSGRGAASLLTRTTAILAGLFFITSLTLAALAGIKKKNDGLNFDAAPASTSAPLSAPLTAPLTLPAPTTSPAPLETAPATPAIPQKSSALDVAPKATAAAAAPAAKTPAAKKPAAAVPAPAAKPAIPEPTEETAPAPAAPAGPTDGASNEASGGGAAGPQPR